MAKPAAHHIESLDALRGFLIAAMIVVNNPGAWEAVLPPLTHTAWHGYTFADSVFPGFVFIMGVAMALAFSKRRQQGHGLGALHRRILVRVLWLVALGLVLNLVDTAPTLEVVRIPGVLQRIGLAYLGAALIVLHTAPRTRAIACAALLLAHWALLTWVPFGGHPGGTLLPDVNLAAHIDRYVFGPHLLSDAGDPEGLLGTLPTIATALLGTFAGDFLRRVPDGDTRVRGLLAGGAISLGLGLLWAQALPVNKPLWTGSYVLVTTGLASIAFALCYEAIDRRRWRIAARPFVWLGVNPLAIYFASELAGRLLEKAWVAEAASRTTARAWVYWRVFDPLFPTSPSPWASLLFALAYTGVWVGVAGLLYRRGIRVQV